MQFRLCFITVFLNVLSSCIHEVSLQNPISFSIFPKSLSVIVGQNETFILQQISGTSQVKTTINLTENHSGLIDFTPRQILIPLWSKNFKQSVIVHGKVAGHVEIEANISLKEGENTDNLFLKVLVAKSSAVIIVSLVVGWIYFIAWSISFYPQIWTNYKRKSVVGLNFDYLALNITGHTLYAIFNASMYWIPTIRNEYLVRFPKGVIPVELNDVFFSIHASVITTVNIMQCVFYERGEQRVSTIARSIISLYFLIVLVTLTLSSVNIIHWIDFLNTCSYIKLSITLIKYVPQVVMNYRRKSTVGWSIGNILLDFVGGIFSMLQMILNSYNYNDFASIFGDPTKFGLGLFSVMFDIIFMTQHYILYRNLYPYESIPASEESTVRTCDDEPFESNRNE